MVNVSRNGVATSLRLGYPRNDGGFAGLVFESIVPLPAVFLGGAIAVSIVWIATRAKPHAAAPSALEPPTKVVSRSAVTN